MLKEAWEGAFCWWITKNAESDVSALFMTLIWNEFEALHAVSLCVCCNGRQFVAKIWESWVYSMF